MFNEFSSENLQQCPDNMRPTDLCFSPLPPSHLVTSPVGLIAITSHNFPLFEMLELERAWLFNNHFRLNSKLRRKTEAVIGRCCVGTFDEDLADYLNISCAWSGGRGTKKILN